MVTMKHGAYLKADRIIYDLLQSSDARATSPREAQFFFVPIFFGSLGNRSSSRRSSRLDDVDAALAALSEAAPHAWPSQRAKHVFVVTLDRGRCFQDDLRDRFGDATVLMYEGTEAYPGGKRLPFACHRRSSDVVIPPVVDAGAHAVQARVPEIASPVGKAFPWSFFTHRKWLGVWRGSDSRMQWADKANVASVKAGAAVGAAAGVAAAHPPQGTEEPESVAGVNVRQQLLQLYGHAAKHSRKGAHAESTGGNGRTGSSSSSAVAATTTATTATAAAATTEQPRASSMELLVSSHKLEHAMHFAEMRQSVFCLCPVGWAQWTVRFFESVQMGCVPVTFAPRVSPRPLRMPFDDTLDYSSFSINVPPDDLASLQQTLVVIASNRTRLRALQKALWHVRPLLDWTDLSAHGAFHRMLEALHQRRTSAMP